MAKDTIQSIVDDAMTEATLVLEDVFKMLEVPPPTQDQMRQAFRLAMASPENMQAFQDAFGPQEYDRQMMLAIRRANNAAPRF